MAFNSVFHSLKELFPQVDVRILKAVAIEHSKDVTEAVEAILFEVLPTISSKQEVLPTSGDNHEDEQGETIVLRHCETVEEANAGLRSETNSVACNIAFGTDHTNDTVSVRSTCSDEASDNDHTNDTLSVESICSNEAAAGSVVLTSHGINVLEKLYAENDDGEVISSVEHQEVNPLDGSSNYGSIAVPSFTTPGLDIFSGHSVVALHSDNQDLADVSLPSIHIENDEVHLSSWASSPKGVKSDTAYVSFSSISRENHQDNQCSASSSPKGQKSPTVQEFELPVYEEKLGSVCSRDVPDKTVSNIVSGYRKTGSSCSLASSGEPLTSGSHMDDIVNKSQPTTITSGSGQIISIEFLEEFIFDAKNYKKTLLSAMESILNKVRDVEIQEKAAEQAKEEAYRSGLDILAEVENLKQMVHQARGTYDMHAGELYGEKSILATEARELQSRLLNLSNERDKSLFIIDEMQQTLQERLAAVEAEKLAAEKERLEKEESARKALDEQVAIMDKVVKESKKLQQEAEENSKLREFLMDRGRVVDALQGEISVICEDVKLLKERIDGHLPCSGSLSLSYISTSSSSSNRATPDSVIKQTGSTNSLISPSDEQEQLSGGEQSRNMMSDQSEIASLDDEWVLFFKNEAECH